jgi:glycosyltransferase involved in cell wall biosynthesis
MESDRESSGISRQLPKARPGSVDSTSRFPASPGATTVSTKSSEFSVDIVIPTYNCVSKLERCLKSIRMQDWNGQVKLSIVDGGSTDGTIELGRSFGADCWINPGQYATGAGGARRFGEKHTAGTFLWNLDSDNVVVERWALTHLVRPLIEDPSLNVSMPELSTFGSHSSLSRWAALAELEKIKRLERRSQSAGRYLINDELDYGLVNGALIRRTALEKVGGYDSDVRLLARLRKHSLAKAAIVPTAHVGHDYVDSLSDYVRKMDSRIARFGQMSEEDLEAFFVDPPGASTGDRALLADVLYGSVSAPAIAIREWILSGDSDWAWGMILPLVNVCLLLRRPASATRILRQVY